MTKLTKDEILHVAKLAKLDIKDSELDKYAAQLSNVINYFSELNEVDVKNVDPTSQTTGLENVYREDEISGAETLTQDQALSGSDKIHNGYFKVKAILEGRSDK